MIPNRIKRVSTLIKSEISDIIRREFKDERMGFTSITEVRVSKDLSSALVFVSFIGEKETLEAVVGSLNRAAGFIRGRVRDNIAMRRMPALKFVPDDSIERGVQLCALMDKLKEEEEEKEES